MDALSSLKVPGFSLNVAIVGKYCIPMEENSSHAKIESHIVGPSSEKRGKKSSLTTSFLKLHFKCICIYSVLMYF